jgi:hypothetical protein
MWLTGCSLRRLKLHRTRSKYATLFVGKHHSCLKQSSDFALDHLVKDDKDLCREVYERGTLEKVVLLAKHITPLERTSEWEEDEPESTLALREVSTVFSPGCPYLFFITGNVNRDRSDLAL